MPDLTERDLNTAQTDVHVAEIHLGHMTQAIVEQDVVRMLHHARELRLAARRVEVLCLVAVGRA